MRLIYAELSLLLIVITSAQCQMTAEDWYNKGVGLYAQDKYEEAIKAFDEAIRLNPNDVAAWINKGNALCMQDKYDDAIKDYNEAIRLDPNYATALNNKGNALNALGRTAEADAAFAKAKELKESKKPRETAEEWSNKGIAFVNLGKYDDAIRAYNEAIRLDPNLAGAWNNKGIAFEKQGKYDDAIKAYDEAIKLDPNFAVVWNNKGAALVNLSSYDDAIKAYDEAIRLDPNLAAAWINKGIALGKQGKYDEALTAHDKAIKLDPNLARTWNNKSVTIRKQGKYDDAKSDVPFTRVQTDQDEGMVSPTTGIKPHSNEVKVAEEHTYMVGTPGINEFMLNWTDNKVYSSKISADIFDERDDNDDVYLTNYLVRLLDESETDVPLSFVITWHPNVKRPSALDIEKYPYELDIDGTLSRSDVTIQGKKALMLTYKDKKEYKGSESEPLITPACYLARYFLDDYTEIGIEGGLQDWPNKEFKSMLTSVKITPPDGYY